MNHTTTRQVIEQSDAAGRDYFISTYKGQDFNYAESGSGTSQMLLDFTAMIDSDKDGKITAADVEEAWDIVRIAKKGKESNSAELNYKHQPKAVADVLKQWDADQSGSVGVSELVMAGEAQKKMASENRLVKKLLGMALTFIVILMAATFGLSFTAVQMAKDSRPDASGIQQLPDGKPVANAQAKEVKSLSEWPSLPFDTLTRAESFNLEYDGTAHHMKIASLEQDAASDLSIKTLDGRTVEISAEGIIKVSGVVKEGAGRRLWGGSLMTSGSFQMMASTGA